MFSGIPYSIFWLIVAVLLAVVEAFTLGIATIWFAIGALLAMFVALLGLPFIYQVSAFIILSAVLLYFTRPIVKKYLKIRTESTNADRLIGKTGIVIEKIDSIQGIGQVKILGQIWSARSADNDIIVGERVEVQEIAGVRLIVKRVEEIKNQM
jgi:membrane protein implicated in regulation of membrane protease activity